MDDQNVKEKKLAYVKLFEPLNIFIGTGEYLYYFEEDIKKDVLLWLENYRFGDNNYLFIYDTQGTILMHPILPDLLNKNIGDLKDSTGYEFGKEYLKSSESDSSVADTLTISFGVSSIVPGISEDYSLLIKSADAALYRAKANGRNRIESQED